MPRRAATVTQADIARAIRAAQAAGLPVTRIVVRSDGVSVEISPHAPNPEANGEIPEPEFADSEPLVLL